MIRFARAMREHNRVFARRVETFEDRHGALDPELLAVAAQANFLCWFEASFPGSLLSACRGIASGHPTQLTLCQQVSPERWQVLHAGVVAVQRWLGEPREVPSTIDAREVCRLTELLSERTPARTSLARLYLWTLVQHLRLNTSFGQLASEGSFEESRYQDYRDWYLDARLGERGDGEWGAFLTECERNLAQELPGRAADAEQLLRELAQGRGGSTRPPCAQRFTRYQEIRLASIGALKWRGNAPVADRPRVYWEALFQDATLALATWLAETTPQSALGAQIHDALGRVAPEKRSMVTGFLMQAPEEGGFFQWLAADARASGHLADGAFEEARGPSCQPR